MGIVYPPRVDSREVLVDGCVGVGGRELIVDVFQLSMPKQYFVVSFMLIIINSLIPLTNADPRTDIISRDCSEHRMEDTAIFLENYWEANDQVEDDMLIEKYGFGAAGKFPDRVYIMAQCYDDLSHEDCKVCYSECRNVIPTCLPNAGGRVFLDGCFMRAANYNFFGETVTSKDVLICGSTKGSPTFTRLATQAIDTLVEKTLSNSGFAVSSEETTAASIYSVGICWKTLDVDSCWTCISSAAKSVSSCLPATEGRSLKAGCVIRYSDYAFANSGHLAPHRLKNMTTNTTTTVSTVTQGDRSSFMQDIPSLSFINPDMVVAFVVFVFGTTAAALLAICIGVLVGKVIYTRKNNQHNPLQQVDVDSSLFKRSLRFKYSTIVKATEHFSEANKIGQGGFGEVFKGCLGDGREIAVKRLFLRGNNQSQEVYNEMNIISQAQHKNLVRFLGCSLNGEDNLIVYEFLPNKSLNLVLFDPEKKKELDWKKRVGIITGTAEGLDYIHNEFKIVVVHRDIKASNILLDHRFRPKIADFGLARFCSGDQIPPGAPIAGTFGYMAPEYISRGQLTEKVDVYSYGVLVLEIVSGVQNSKFNPDESLETLVTSAWKHFKSNKISEIVDESMVVENIQEVKRIVQVGLLCTQESPSLRPTMKEVVRMLRQKDLQLPEPSKPPFFDESMLENSSSTISRYSDACASSHQHHRSTSSNNSNNSSSCNNKISNTDHDRQHSLS